MTYWTFIARSILFSQSPVDFRYDILLGICTVIVHKLLVRENIPDRIHQ